MVQQALLHSRIALCLFVVMCGCQEQLQKHAGVQGLSLPYNDPGLSNGNGIIYFQQRPFSGLLLTFGDQMSDTLILASYHEGKEHGVWTKYYENGRLKEQRQFKSGKKIGQLKSWWPDGRQQSLYNFENDEYHGQCTEWNAHGISVKQMHYNHGHEEGAQKSWYDNGNIRSNYVVNNGRRYGLLGTKNCVNVSDSIFRK